MNKFKFHLPTTIYFGVKEFERIKKCAPQLGKTALIIIGQGSVKKNGYLSKLEKYLDEAKIKHQTFEGIEPNPRSTTINKAGKLAAEINADMLIALGGGSVMDATKGIAIVAKSNDDIWSYCSTRERPGKNPCSALPIICIPTLAATGSEVNGGTVITNFETKQKTAIHSQLVVPKFSIIDPELTNTVPKDYLVDGAVDIICHSIETYLSNTKKFSIQDYLTLGITRTVKNSIETLLEDPSNIEARADLCWSSSVAMMGLLGTRQGGWPIHLIEHAISGIYDVSHGLGLAHLIIPTLEFNQPYNSKKTLELIGFMLHENTAHYKDHDKALKDLEQWLNSIGALRKLSSNTSKIDVKAVAEKTIEVSGNKDGYIYGVVPMYVKDIEAVLKKAFS